MAFDHSEFITSAPSLSVCPEPTLPEICFAGRSNVGKSSLINRITNKKRLARTSNTPGKTQQMNYYLIDKTFYLVDLPGFGFARVPEKERQRWGHNIRQYLLERETLELTMHLLDARHKPTGLDEEFIYWMASNEKPFSILLAKSDKITTNKMNQSVAFLRKLLEEMNIDVPVIPCSADSGKGISEIQSLILEFSNRTLTNPNLNR